MLAALYKGIRPKKKRFDWHNMKKKKIGIGRDYIFLNLNLFYIHNHSNAGMKSRCVLIVG